MTVEEFIKHLDIHGGMSNREYCGEYNLRPTQKAMEHMAENYNEQFAGDQEYEHMLLEPSDFDGLYCLSGSNMWNVMDSGGGTFGVPLEWMKEVGTKDLIELGYIKEDQVTGNKIRVEA